MLTITIVTAQVALGETKDITKVDTTIDKAPDGYHSVHGVKKTSSNNSDFDDDEYCVYPAYSSVMLLMVVMVMMAIAMVSTIVVVLFDDDEVRYKTADAALFGAFHY